MDILNAILLGIVEGLTEFLPVSSTGHLILVESLLGVDGDDPKWRVSLFVYQVGAIAAVVVYFWRDLWRRTFHPKQRAWSQHIFTQLVTAMVPTIALALALSGLMEHYLETGPHAPLIVAGGLIVGAFIMEFIDRRFRRKGPMDLAEVNLRQAFGVGAIQCLSMWPGVSRAGASIMGGMVLGMTPRVAAEFSFYLAIPTMLAAATKRLWDYRADLSGGDAGVIVIGTATSFLVALGVVATFMAYVRRYRFTPFVVYRIVLGLAIIACYVWRR